MSKLSLYKMIIFTTLFAPFIGMTFISPQSLFDNPDSRFIFLYLRTPRVVGAIFSGGLLGISGLIFQTLFKTPLASPYTLGVSGGASLGAAVVLFFSGGVSYYFVSGGAFIGALLVTFPLLFFLRRGAASGEKLLLAGIVFSTITGSFLLLLHYVGGERFSFSLLRWSMGDIHSLSWRDLAVALPFALILLLYVSPLWGFLDHLHTGDALAASRGVDIDKLKRRIVVIASLMTAIVVSSVGPIGFIGILAPQFCRLLFPGRSHKEMAPAVFLTGATFLVWADTIARAIIPGVEIPVGVITSLVGGVFFIFLLLIKV